MIYRRINQYLEIQIDSSLNNITMEDFFHQYHLSKKMIHELRMSKDVYLNDESVGQNFKIKLSQNDKLKIPIFIDEEIDFKPQNIPLDIIYEDDFILVVNKQANLEVHPDNKDGSNTLVNAVAFYYQQNQKKHRVRYIHRLDKDTTGAIILVKNHFVHNLYDHLIQTKQIKRYYIALVENVPKKKKGIIQKNIGKDRHHNQRRIVSESGVYAETAYEIIKKYPNYTLVRLELFTGRTHQIRVHMASINCPLLGDTLYGTPSPLIKRQALHAEKILLLHPITLTPLMLEARIPQDMNKLLKYSNLAGSNT